MKSQMKTLKEKGTASADSLLHLAKQTSHLEAQLATRCQVSRTGVSGFSERAQICRLRRSEKPETPVLETALRRKPDGFSQHRAARLLL